MNKIDELMTQERAPGFSIGLRLTLTFLLFLFVVSTTLIIFYQAYIPPLVNEQIDLRTRSIAQSFQAAVIEPVLTRDYIRVNKISETTAQLPDVAYAAVINKQGFAIAGLFGDVNRFDSAFKAAAREGFPKLLIPPTRLAANSPPVTRDFTAGQQAIHEIRMPLDDTTGAEIQIGLFTEQVQQAMDAAFTPLVIVLALMTVLGTLTMLFIARTIAHPIRQLTEQAYRISMGELDQDIQIKASGEIWQLARSFGRMQASMKYAVEQLRKNQQ